MTDMNKRWVVQDIGEHRPRKVDSAHSDPEDSQCFLL